MSNHWEQHEKAYGKYPYSYYPPPSYLTPPGAPLNLPHPQQSDGSLRSQKNSPHLYEYGNKPPVYYPPMYPYSMPFGMYPPPIPLFQPKNAKQSQGNHPYKKETTVQSQQRNQENPPAASIPTERDYFYSYYPTMYPYPMPPYDFHNHPQNKSIDYPNQNISQNQLILPKSPQISTVSTQIVKKEIIILSDEEEILEKPEVLQVYEKPEKKIEKFQKIERKSINPNEQINILPQIVFEKIVIEKKSKNEGNHQINVEQFSVQNAALSGKKSKLQKISHGDYVMIEKKVKKEIENIQKLQKIIISNEKQQEGDPFVIRKQKRIFKTIDERRCHQIFLKQMKKKKIQMLKDAEKRVEKSHEINWKRQRQNNEKMIEPINMDEKRAGKIMKEEQKNIEEKKGWNDFPLKDLKYLESHGKIRLGNYFQANIPPLITNSIKFPIFKEQVRLELRSRQISAITF